MRMIPGTYCIAVCLFVSGWWYHTTFRPWTHTSDDSYIYQLSLVVVTKQKTSKVSHVFYFYFYFLSSLLLSSSTCRRFYPQRSSRRVMVTVVVPSPPRYVPSILIGSAHLLLDDFNRISLTHALALSRVNFYARKSPFELVHSVKIELSKYISGATRITY